MSYIEKEDLLKRIDASPLFDNFGEDGLFIKDFVMELIQQRPDDDVNMTGAIKNLKTCPFCGGKAEVVSYSIYGKVKRYFCKCIKCDCQSRDYTSKQNAKKAWNRRKSDTDIVNKTIDAVRSKGVRNAYSCMVSGKLHETYTIKGTALEEIVKEITE